MMKNLIGFHPGSVYCLVRSCLHDIASENESPGIAFEIPDMVKACTPGLVVIDGSMAMEGDGPSNGDLVKTDMIIAGTIESGIRPSSVDEIEIRGESLGNVQQAFKKPDIVPWTDINSWFGAKEI